MNSVQIKLNPYSGMNTISINGCPLAAYSELNNYMREPFLIWAPKLLETIDRELNDDYELTLMAEAFEASLLEALQKDHTSCIKCKCEKFSLQSSPKERKNKIDKITQKYLKDSVRTERELAVYVDKNVLDYKLVHDSNCEIQEAFVVITDANNIHEEYVAATNVRFLLVVSEGEKINYRKGTFLWYLPEEKIQDVVEAMYEHFILIPSILETVEYVKSSDLQLPQEEQLELRLITEIEPIIFIDSISKIEKGTTVPISYSVIPNREIQPEIRVAIENEKIMAYDKKKMILQGLETGQTAIHFYRGEEVIPFQTMRLEVYQNHFAQKIMLSVDVSIMEVNQERKILCEAVPYDAEDISEFEWSVDRPDFATIDKQGMLHALNEGICTVTVQGKLTSASIQVQILPSVKKIELSKEQISCYVGEETAIGVKIFPENCFDSSYKWITSDASVAAVERKSNGVEYVKANGIGNCSIICMTKDEKIKSICNVLVESTFKKAERKQFWLQICAMLFAAFWVFTVFHQPMFSSICFGGIVVSGILAIIKNRSDCFWALILMLIPIATLLFN